MSLVGRELKTAENSAEQIANHEKIVQGIRTRFPPEPNGYLHIGHAKSMLMNFETAFEKLNPQDEPKQDRQTIFRYDDTNPEAESEEYIDAIRENVEWLGWKPYKTTYSSDYFQELYELAVKLIKLGKAYVCEQSKPEIETSRNILREVHSGKKSPEEMETGISEACSPFRSRSIEENLAEFEKMKRGLYAEGQVCLRMKMDLHSPNPNMWDSVAYRIKYVSHPHIGDKWCIYPTYDYTHCLVDSLEHIDYSICTLEFETRRESYYWLLDTLDLYKPKVYEFARLSLGYTVLSKRKLLYLVNNGLVTGWDDPRLSTLNGLKRRGFTPSILNAFCKEIGVTRVQSNIQIQKLHSVARRILGDECERAMAIFDPIKVIVDNYPKDKKEQLQAPLYPQDPNCKEFRQMTFCNELFIDRKDFALDTECESNFFGLSVGEEVALKYAYNVTCTKVVMNTQSPEKIDVIHVTVDTTKMNKPKGNLTWVSKADARKCIVRVYDHLFTVEDLAATDTPYLELLNPKSLIEYPNAIVDSSFSFDKKIPQEKRLQFERAGYFSLDVKDSAKEKKMVWNQIVALKDTSTVNSKGSDAKTKESLKLRKKQQEEQLALKNLKESIPPQEFFKSQTDLYSQFDKDGVPTHDKDGKEITKNQVKKLKKEWAKVKKIFDKANNK